ncbi:MAG TPA: exodeoxyribonuclease VII large subunit [Acidimicrobiales bacterium]|nr:exodeoxyribonuclease VII large subunit [Acidimicrobiales bacterium]
MPRSSASIPTSRDSSQLFDPESPPVDGNGEGQGAAATQPAGNQAQERPGVLSIGALYDEVESALAQAFPRRRHLWVRGEIQHISDHRSGHLYLDLTDPDDTDEPANPNDPTAPTRRRPPMQRNRGGEPTLKVKCWRTQWIPLRHTLAKEGIELTEGMVVVLRGSLDLYRAKGELSLILTDIDVTALLGRIAAQRTKLLRALEADGLLRRNARLPVPELPLHVGLVASPDTEGLRDFLGQLTDSGFGFRISHVPVRVQGNAAPATIARALRALSRSDCDVIALVRGGGARADLAAFETELVARAVAESAKPVWTGIGHTGDQTVADIVAARTCITPTECGQAIVHVTRHWWATHVAVPAGLLSRRVPTFLADAQSRDAAARGRLAAAARHQLRVHRDRLGARATAAARRAPATLDRSAAGLRARSARLGPLALGHVASGDEQVRNWRRLLAAYDVDRQLERGYSLTLTAEGTLVRRAADLAPDQEIVTRLADGTVRSTVTGMQSDPARAEPEDDQRDQTEAGGSA